jgi:hypothetical protein
MSTMPPPAGWYADPGHPAYLRYWDGATWTGHVADLPSAGAPAKGGRGSPTGKQLLRASLGLFRENRRMFWLPVLSGVLSALAFLIVSGLVFVPLHRSFPTSGLDVVFLFPASVAATFSAVFFNVALVFAANEQIEGRTVDIRTAVRMAWGRKRVVFSWALLSATVGLVIQSVERRLGIFGRLAGLLGGLAWAVANFLVIPVLAFEDLGPIAALKQSSHLIRTTFGTIARAALRFGFLFLGWSLAALAVMIAGGVLAGSGALVPGVIVGAIGVVGFFVVLTYVAAAGMYMRTILYRYATGKPVPELGLDLSRTFSR